MSFKVKSAALIAVFFMVVLCSSEYFANETKSHDQTYKIGGRGPGGGFVFYDKGNADDGWRYLEAAPEDQGKAKWGCYGTEISGSNPGIGSGMANTRAIINACDEEGIAAKVAAAYRGGGKSGWFLPSKDELHMMYINLHKAEVGGFANGNYWGSSEYSADFGWYQNFGYGFQYSSNKGYPSRVRAVRAF